MGDVIEKMEKIVNENVSAKMSQVFSENALGIRVGNGYFGDTLPFADRKKPLLGPLF
jgi:hypothetical protein